MDQSGQERLMAVMMRIRGDHPFFGTLALFATFHLNDQVATAATDGKDIWLNPAFIKPLDFHALAGLIVHELLHAALQHCLRRRERNRLLWNIAADIVVNDIILENTDYALPQGAISDHELGRLSVEEVYEQLQVNRCRQPSLQMIDLVERQVDAPDVQQDLREIKSHWHGAISQARTIAKLSGRGYGHEAASISREIEEFLDPTLGWRDLLWQYVLSTPFDYSGFDRRFIWQGLYLDEVIGEKVQAAIAIDTSSSISQGELAEFISEIQGLLDAYPVFEGTLFYADTELYGPYEFSNIDEIPKPQGGGGTSFVKFFQYMEKNLCDDKPLCLYFTDGFGEFPAKPPDLDVIWVICSGGVCSEEIPFGKVVRMGA